MKILVFTEGTILMHCNAKGLPQRKIIEQVKNKESSVKDFSSYIPIGDAPKKLSVWKSQGAHLIYLTSRTKKDEIMQIRKALKRHAFPKGTLLYRKEGEEYKDVAQKAMPDILVEDDCESIGGIHEMTITHIKGTLKGKIIVNRIDFGTLLCDLLIAKCMSKVPLSMHFAIKSIIVKEFWGIDHLPDNISELKVL